MTERVQERFSRVPPRTQVFAGDVATLSAAVQLTFKRLDFSVNGPTGDFARLEASSRIHHSQALGDDRQLVAAVHLQDAGPGQVEVQILLSEEVEGASAGGGSEQALREHGFYGTFFETLQQVLAEKTPGRPTGAK